MIHVAHSGPALLASFLASSVECVEAMTIVLAVGAVRGWRPALLGAGLAAVLLASLVAIFGAGLALIPLASVQTAIGVLLLLFGMRWLRKAVLRAGGVIALRDEAANYASETGALRHAPGKARGWDAIGIATSFKAVSLEGIEVVFIVIALGAVGGALIPATVGALAAAVLVAAVGLCCTARWRGCRKTRSNSQLASCCRALARFGSVKATVSTGRAPICPCSG